MLTPEEVRGVYVIMPTPATRDAERWDAEDTVNLDETARLAEQLIRDGVDGIIALGSGGEAATITPDEFRSFVDCLLSTVNQRVPTFIGATTLGTHETVQRIRFLRERGASGTMLGLPMWQPPTTELALDFYGAISEAFPGLPVLVYGNPVAFRYDFPLEFWEHIAVRAPTAAVARFGNPQLLPELLRLTGGRIKFLPPESQALACARVAPQAINACWSMAACTGPHPVIVLMQAILAGDWQRAEEVTADFAWADENYRPGGNLRAYASFILQQEKTRVNAGGYCDAGPLRPPYHVFPEELAAAARETGRRWGQLREKYRAEFSA